jgi:hypothetical protein
MDLLVVLGTSAAFFFSLYQLLLGMPHLYFEAAAVVVTLVLLGRVLEARARRSAVAAIRALMKLRPDTARIERNGRAVELPAEALRPGDILIVKPGERFPADGEVLEGESEADESLLTGESLPVAKKPGDKVIGGALNGDGLLRVKATSGVHEGVLARIIAFGREARASKAPIEKLVDRVSAVFVPWYQARHPDPSPSAGGSERRLAGRPYPGRLDPCGRLPLRPRLGDADGDHRGHGNWGAPGHPAPRRRGARAGAGDLGGRLRQDRHTHRRSSEGDDAQERGSDPAALPRRIGPAGQRTSDRAGLAGARGGRRARPGATDRFRGPALRPTAASLARMWLSAMRG